MNLTKLYWHNKATLVLERPGETPDCYRQDLYRLPDGQWFVADGEEFLYLLEDDEDVKNCLIGAGAFRELKNYFPDTTADRVRRAGWHQFPSDGFPFWHFIKI